MKRFIFVFAISVLSNLALAHELGLEPYLKMQESLANDDFKQALASHKLICDKELIHYTDDYKDCKKPFKNIDELRSSFKTLSEVYIANGAKDELKNVEKATCPMAKAKWLQRKGDLKNPYYGKSMLECGEKIP